MQQWKPLSDGIYRDAARVHLVRVDGKNLTTAYDYDPGCTVTLAEQHALCCQVPDEASVPVGIAEAWKLVASALPQGMSFEVFMALNELHNWFNEQMKGEASDGDTN